MNNTAKLGLLLPAVLNPATAAVIGIAAIAVGLYRMLPDDDEEVIVDAVATNVSDIATSTVEATLPAVELSEAPPVEEPFRNPIPTAPAGTSEADQSETIRKAMSELGKRSAAARAKKKAERQE